MAVLKKKLTAQKKIQAYLKERGIKQSWLAEKTGISNPHISNIIAERVLFTQENLDKINSVLGTDFTME